MQTDCFPDAAPDRDKEPIGKLATINPHYKSFKGREYPFIEMAAVAEQFGGIQYITKRNFEGSGLARFKVGDTLFAKITPCPENGKVAFVGDLPDELGIGSTEFIVLSPREGCDPRFLYHLACCHDVRGRAIGRMEGSTGRQRVPDDAFKKRLIVPVPSPEEQAAIAHILDAVDTAIERTQRIVCASEDLRQSLMEAAFTGHFERGAKKQTELGELPTSWNWIKGKQAFHVLSSANTSVGDLRITRNGEEPDAWFMKVNDFNTPTNRWSIKTTKLGFTRSDNKSFRVFPLGVIIIAKRGVAISKNRVRVSHAPLALDPNLMAIEALSPMKPEFLRYQLEWRSLARYAESSGVPQLNNKDLYPRYFISAPERSQDQITEVLQQAEKHQDALFGKERALRELKRSLMHNLLTGKVRTAQLKPDEVAA